jgi:hypothetical protein
MRCSFTGWKAGLVKQRARKVVPRCQLYAEYFRDRLNPND